MKTINILGVTFTVEEVDVVNKMIPRRGEIDYLTCNIRIDKNMPREMKNVTLAHEILHAIFDMLGYDELNEDEEKVQGLATALHQVFTAQTIFSF